MVKFKKKIFVILMVICLTFGALSFVGCNDDNDDTTNEDVVPPESVTPSIIETNEDVTEKLTIDVNSYGEYFEGFGTSLCWWAQDVGRRTEKSGDTELRELAVKALFDKETGLGLTNLRYNLGANCDYSDYDSYYDKNRFAESFMTMDGTLDFTRDSGAQWVLKRAVEYGVQHVTLFANSAPTYLTINGKAYCTNNARINLAPENYSAYAKYFCDVAEHFIDEGIPVKEISPINEPQWDWVTYGGQEGSHFTPNEVVEILLVFLSEMKSRDKLTGVKLAYPECGEWKNATYNYLDAIMANDTLRSEIDAFSCHSYWSNKLDKTNFINYVNEHYEGLKLRQTEWCEMVNGRNVTMASAFTLAQEIIEDLSILEVVSWDSWIGLSNYDYHDGLLYFENEGTTLTLPKRYYAMAHFSQFITPGVLRIDSKITLAESTKNSHLKHVVYRREDGKLVIVITNTLSDKVLDVSALADYNNMEVYITNEDYSMERVYNGETLNRILVPTSSILTLVLNSDKVK